MQNTVTQSINKASQPLFIKTGSHYTKVVLADIDFFFYEGRYANLSINGTSYTLNFTMKELANILPSNQFIQVHQSFILNSNKITKISFSTNEILLEASSGEKTIPIGGSFKKGIQENLFILY